MKKFLCLILTLCLLLGTAGAEDMPGMRFEGSIDITDACLDTLLFTDDPQLKQALQSVLQNLSLRIHQGEQVTRLQFCLKDQMLLETVTEEKNGMVYTAFSLLPDDVFAEPFLPEDQASLDANLQALLNDYIPQAEKGIFKVESISQAAYNTRLMVDITSEQLSDCIVQMVDLLLDAEALDAQYLAAQIAASDLYLKGDYYTRKNGDDLGLFRLYLDAKSALDLFWASEDGYITAALVPCDAPTSTRIEMNVEKALMDDTLEGMILTYIPYDQGMEGMVASPMVMCFFSQEEMQDRTYGTWTMETTPEYGALALALTYEFGQDDFNLEGKWLESNAPWLTFRFSGNATPDTPESLSLEGKNLLTEDMLTDENTLLRLEQELLAAVPQLLINCCIAMPDEMAVLTTYLVKLGSYTSFIGVGDDPSALLIPEEENENADTTKEPETTPRPLFTPR